MNGKGCPLNIPDLSEVETVFVRPDNIVADYRQAVVLANAKAASRYEEYMLISWYDRERDFESPQNASESREGSITDGYIHYALNHGATLKVDVDDGRYVFFYTPVEW